MATGTLTTVARWLKRGDTFDPEDHRMTHRLRVARHLLAEVQIEPTIEHGPFCKHNWNNHSGVQMDCYDRCLTLWPEWVTDEMFQEAANAANAIQNLRRISSQAQINRERAAR